MWPLRSTIELGGVEFRSHRDPVRVGTCPHPTRFRDCLLRAAQTPSRRAAAPQLDLCHAPGPALTCKEPSLPWQVVRSVYVIRRFPRAPMVPRLDRARASCARRFHFDATLSPHFTALSVPPMPTWFHIGCDSDLISSLVHINPLLVMPIKTVQTREELYDVWVGYLCGCVAQCANTSSRHAAPIRIDFEIPSKVVFV